RTRCEHVQSAAASKSGHPVRHRRAPLLPKPVVSNRSKAAPLFDLLVSARERCRWQSRKNIAIRAIRRAPVVNRVAGSRRAKLVLVVSLAGHTESVIVAITCNATPVSPIPAVVLHIGLGH